MDEIQRSSERDFVHGRYLDPVTLKCVDEEFESKSATFVSLPAFSADHTRTHDTDREFEGHPVRALLQSRHRLESTDRRDKLQVLTHYSTEDRVVTVPQIWALVINTYTVITWAPVGISELFGKTIQTKPCTNASEHANTCTLYFSDLQGNAFSFTDLHFMDPQGKVSCVPLALCRTWFGLVKCIVEDCIDDEFGPIKETIKYDLLNGGPSFQLIQEDESTVTMNSWPQVLKNKTGIIHLRLADHQGKFKRLLVTYHVKRALGSEPASDISVDINDGRGGHAGEPPTEPLSDAKSDTTVSSTASTTAEGKSSDLANKLCGLRAELQEAKTHVDWERVLALSSEIPILEDRILEWTAENLRSELRDNGDVFEEAEATLPALSGQRWRLGTAHLETSSLTSTNESHPESEFSSGSASSSRSTSPSHDREQAIRSERPPMRTPRHLPYAVQPSISNVNPRGTSPIRPLRYRGSFRMSRSRGLNAEVSHIQSVPSHSRASLRPLSSQKSQWDTVRLRVLDGQLFSRLATQNLHSQPPGNAARLSVLSHQGENRHRTQKLPYSGKDERRKLASGEQGAPTIVSRALSGHSQNISQGRHDNIGDTSSYHNSPNKSSKLPNTAQDSLELPRTVRAPPVSSTLPHDSALRSETNATSREPQKEGNSQPQRNETRPALRRLVDFALKAAAILPNSNVKKTLTGTSTLIPEQGTEGFPIFLWSMQQKQSIISRTQMKMTRTKSVESEAIPKATSAKNGGKPEEAVNTSKTEQHAFEMLLADMHNDLLKPCDPGRKSRKHALFYERTVGRSAAEAEDLVTLNNRSNIESTVENTDPALPMKQRKGKRKDGGDSSQNVIAVENSRLAADSPHLMTEHFPESHALRLRSDVFVLAGKILRTFIPGGCDAPIISKYWGAVHKLLRQDVVPVENLPVTQIVLSKLSKLHERLRDVQKGMRTIDGSQPTLDQLPKSFIAAFQQILMLFVVASNIAELQMIYNADPHPDLVPRHHLEAISKDCKKLLILGKMETLELIRNDDRDGAVGSLAIDSEALLSLILANFAFHSSESENFNLTNIYRDYTAKLRSLVHNRAYVRVHDHIPLLNEELDVIKTILKQQHRTLYAFRKNVDIDTTSDISHLSLTVLNNLLENVNQRIRKFEELLVEAQSALAQSRSLKSESNNKAILVFTVTTIIFLPLSFVTSYLGMNTSDLRNMQSGQTLFWAIGAPVAFLVFGIALLAAYYGEVTHRLTRLYWRRKDDFE